MTFGLAALGVFCVAAANELLPLPEKITLQKLGTAGVRIPICDYKVLDGERIQFWFNKDEIKKWDFIWAKTAALYPGPEKDGDEQCPFIDVPRGYTTREPLDGNKVRITMQVNAPIIEAINEYGCVLTPRPAP